MAGKTLTKKKTDELFSTNEPSSTSSTIEKNTLLPKLSAKSKQKQLKKEEKEKTTSKTAEKAKETAKLVLTGKNKHGTIADAMFQNIGIDSDSMEDDGFSL